MNESNIPDAANVNTKHMSQGLAKFFAKRHLNFYQQFRLIVIEDGSDDFLMKQYIDDLIDGYTMIQNPLIVKQNVLTVLLEIKPLITKCVTLEQALLQVTNEKDYFKNVVKDISISERANSQRNYRIHVIKQEIIASFNDARNRIINLLEYINSTEHRISK